MRDPFFERTVVLVWHHDEDGAIGVVINRLMEESLQHVLHATDGIDVSDCEFVIRYSKFATTKAHIQGSGRARKPNAECFYMENQPLQEEAQAEVMRHCAAEVLLQLSEVERMARINLGEVAGFYPFRLPGGGMLNLLNSVEVVQEYCCKVH